MEIPSKLKLYAYHNIIAIDQLFNALTGGAADETLSSRTYRGAILAEQPKKRWRVLYRFINWLFRDKKPLQNRIRKRNKRQTARLSVQSR